MPSGATCAPRLSTGGVNSEHWWPISNFVSRQIALVTIRIAKMLPDLVDHVELVARQIVADPVAGVLGEPVFAGAGIDVAADAVADAQRPDFSIAGLGINAADLRHAGRGNADVEG